MQLGDTRIQTSKDKNKNKKNEYKLLKIKPRERAKQREIDSFVENSAIKIDK